jgi:hypothetical protein
MQASKNDIQINTLEGKSGGDGIRLATGMTDSQRREITDLMRETARIYRRLRKLIDPRAGSGRTELGGDRPGPSGTPSHGPPPDPIRPGSHSTVSWCSNSSAWSEFGENFFDLGDRSG